MVFLEHPLTILFQNSKIEIDRECFTLHKGENIFVCLRKRNVLSFQC